MAYNSRSIDSSVLYKMPGKSTMDLSRNCITSTGLGRLTPTFCMEVLPGDRLTLHPETLCRFMPLISPVFNKFSIATHYFFVPNRILWSDWTHFLVGAQGSSAGGFPHPYFLRSAIQNVSITPDMKRLANYLQYPDGITGASVDVQLNPFPALAYQAIWNFHYRNTQIQPELFHTITGGGLSLIDLQYALNLHQVNFNPDYFQAMLPVPMSTFQNALTTNTISGLYDSAGFTEQATISAPDAFGMRVNLYDTSGAYTVASLRQAVALQNWLEKNNNSVRYDDFIKIHYGVELQDDKINFPVFLGGVRQSLVVSDVVNTAASQGVLSGNVTGYSQGGAVHTQILEHGFVLGLTFVTYHPIYNNVLPKHLLKLNVFDYYFPDFDLQGEQTVYNVEVNTTHITPDGHFGYLPRFAEYRATFDYITADIRVFYSQWTMARTLNPAAGLNGDFINIVDDRNIFTIISTTVDPILINIHHTVAATRNMSTFPQLNEEFGL